MNSELNKDGGSDSDFVEHEWKPKWLNAISTVLQSKTSEKPSGGFGTFYEYKRQDRPGKRQYIAE
jgi:hypothetical protein